jgi:hypothetical protein
MSKRHKKKKRRNSNNYKGKQKFTKKLVEIASPLSQEVILIKNKINEEEGKIYDLENKKRELTEKLVDRILLNDDLRNLLNSYCYINKELNEKLIAQDHRKKDLGYKESKLTDENKTIIKKITDYNKIGDVDYPVGLYNQICKNPVAICKQKCVYLSYNDIRFKHCLQHNNRPCKHLQWLDPSDLILK